MPDDDPYRRYLIAVGITKDLAESGPAIEESVQRMTRVLTEDFGYKRVTQLDIDPAADQIEKGIWEFCKDCGPDDIVVLYYTSHADADETLETHRLWTGSTIGGVVGTLETKKLAELMLARTGLQNALIILDTCFAGKGAAEALKASAPAMGRGAGKTLELITAGYPREQVVAGHFARLFELAVANPAVAGREPRYLRLGGIVNVINTDESRPPWQTVSLSELFRKTDLEPFFPNRRFNRQLHGLDMLTQLRVEQQKLRASDLRDHFLPRARGMLPPAPGEDVPAELGWRFVGREAALRDLVGWLKNKDDLSARLVTGGPGSGKSAVIARLVVLSDHGWRRTVPMEGLADDTIPPEGSLAEGIHARGLTNPQVLAAVCAAANVKADSPADLLSNMRGASLTVAIDAIDEALDPPGLVSGILQPLVEFGPAQGLRLLLGTRPHLLETLGMTSSSVIDLDDKRYADPASLNRYVLRGLESGDPRSPYHSVPEDVVAAVAKAVAEAAGRSFLVALIVSRTLSSVTEVPDPADPSWRESLPGNAADAMHKDLETRLGDEADRARDLLRPLAFAYGAGLPWEDLWAGLSSKLSGRDYTDDDIMWLIQEAGSYVVETTESDQSVYRLYHAALAEYLRKDCDEDHIHSLFSQFLMDGVPTSRSGRDWSAANPYVLAHLATHARSAGVLDSLLLDPAYLIKAKPAGLQAALPAARDPDAVLAGRAYLRAVHQLRDRPPEDFSFSYLELASRITHADKLSSRIAARAPRRRWSVPWTHWPPEHPHRILDGQLGLVSGVICVDRGDGTPVVASIGHDGKLRTWDAVTSEPGGTYTVGDAPLVAVRAARLPGGRTVIVLLAADGMLHIWDMSTAALLRTIPVGSSWRRLTGLRYADLTLRCLAGPDGRQFALAGGPGIRTSMWELPSGRRVAAFPARATPASIEFMELIDRSTVIAASLGGAAWWICDLETGQELPYEIRRIPFAWLRSLYDRIIRGSHVTYYAIGGGPPVAAVRFFRGKATVWDLTASYPLGTWRRGPDAVDVRLTDGRTVKLPLPLPQKIIQRRQPAEDPGTLVPLRGQAYGSSWLDRGSHEPLSPQLEVTGRFVRVGFEKPGRGPVALTLAGHTADVTGCDWTRLPDGQVIVVTSSRDGTVRRWDISSIEPGAREENASAQVAPHRIVSVPLEDGTPLGLTVADGIDVALWDLRTGEFGGELRERRAPPCAIGAARMAGLGPIAVTFDADEIMRTWNLPDGDQRAQFPADPIRWPSGTALTQLPDGASVAVTSGHGRKIVVWDLATGRMRHVLTGHQGWSACVTCVQGWGLRPCAVAAGTGNRVSVWDLRRGQRRNHFRIVPPWTFLTRHSAGQAHAVCALPLERGRILVLAATFDGMVRALEPRRFPWGARRAGAVPASVVATATLINGRAVVVTAAEDGVLRIWRPEAFARGADDQAPLYEINLEVPVSDITVVDHDMFVMATSNGLTAVQLDAVLLEDYVASLEYKHLRPLTDRAITSRRS
jgi:WD40 repeat protein